MELSTCVRCKKSKPINSFKKETASGAEKISRYCKECRDQSRARFKRIKCSIKKCVGDITCKSCKKTLAVTEYYSNNYSKTGYANRCKQCQNLQATKDRNKKYKLPKIHTIGKICCTCKLYKTKENYYKCKTYEDGLQHRCKECKKLEAKQRNSHNVARIKEKYHSDSVFKIREIIRLKILKSIKNQSKSAKTAKLLGCTGAECMSYLEKLFWPGMTKENHGRNGWVIDHIVPIDSFDKTDPNWQFKCFHYTNLQPLWWEDNEKKWDRLDWTPSESKYELPERLKPSHSQAI